jgi:hypothetical protein
LNSERYLFLDDDDDLIGRVSGVNGIVWKTNGRFNYLGLARPIDIYNTPWSMGMK